MSMKLHSPISSQPNSAWRRLLDTTNRSIPVVNSDKAAKK